MKNIFVFILCFSILSGTSLFAELAKKEELQKLVAELTAKRTDTVSQMDIFTKEYRSNATKIANIKSTTRAGRGMSSRYDKTDVDDETATLIDRCVAARDEYAKLDKELKDHLSKSDAGIARAKKYDEALKEVDVVKAAQSELIKKRALVGQEIRVIVKELDKAKQQLDTLNKTKEVKK